MVSCSGSLAQSHCGEEGALHTNVSGVCGGTCSAPATLGLPRSQVYAFPVYAARAPGCSMGSGPCFARFQFLGSPQKHRLGWACVLCLPARAAQAARSLTGALSLGAVRLIPSAVRASVSVSTNPVRACVCSGKLVSSCDPPSGCQPSRISGSL